MNISEKLLQYNKGNVDSLNLLTQKLYTNYNSKIFELVRNEPTLRKEADVEFEIFVEKLFKKWNHIKKFLRKQSKEKIIINSINKTRKFSFRLYIYKEKKITFHIIQTNCISTDFNEDFLNKYLKMDIGYVYFIKSDFGYKIGCTNNINKRYEQIGLLMPFKINLHSTIYCESYTELEKTLHDLLNEKRINGEWFNISDEDFTNIDIVLKNINLKRIINN